MRIPRGAASIGRVLPPTAAGILVVAAYGPGWFSLALLLVLCGRLSAGPGEALRLPATLLCGVAALAGPQPAGWALVASGGLFFAMEGSNPRRKIAPALAVPAAMLDGGLDGLQIVAAAALVAALLPRRVPARLLGFGGLLAGLLLLGPPRPAEREPFHPEHVAARYPRYDWHDPVSVDMGCPVVELIPPGDPSSQLLVVTQADLPADGGVTAWLSLGDTLVAVGSGRGRYELPLGDGPLRLSLDGDWRPFVRARVTMTTLEEVVP